MKTPILAIRLLIVGISAALFCPPAKSQEQSLDYLSQLGVVESTRESKLCMTIGNGTLKPQDHVDFILDGNVQVRREGEIIGRLTKSCSHDPDAGNGEFFYEVSFKGSALDSPILGLAIVKYRSGFKQENERVVFNPKGPEHHYFRTCASTEGMHLTVWQGQPLKGRRVWHRYYYLGYDVEPDCTEADYK